MDSRFVMPGDEVAVEEEYAAGELLDYGDTLTVKFKAFNRPKIIIT